MTWQLVLVAMYALLMSFAGGAREGLMALLGGLIAMWALRVVNMFGDLVGAGIRELVEQRERRDRLVRELLARLDGRR